MYMQGQDECMLWNFFIDFPYGNKHGHVLKLASFALDQHLLQTNKAN